MGNRSSIARLPANIKNFITCAILEKTHYCEDLVELLKEKGYVVSRSALYRYAHQLEELEDGRRLAKFNECHVKRAEVDAALKLRCLEIAQGDTPEKRIAVAEVYLAWALRI
ncbi:MAG: DUF3486 family protein [Desulfovibrio sp.]|jgi:hypothetical protein|nr:DUF3486 family protein [Desulfovibrio sp.]